MRGLRRRVGSRSLLWLSSRGGDEGALLRPPGRAPRRGAEQHRWLGPSRVPRSTTMTPPPGAHTARSRGTTEAHPQHELSNSDASTRSEIPNTPRGVVRLAGAVRTRTRLVSIYASKVKFCRIKASRGHRGGVRRTWEGSWATCDASLSMKKLAARFGRVVKRATGDVRDKPEAPTVTV